MSEPERLAVEYSEALTMTPPTVDDDLRARVSAQFTPRQVTELTHVIVVENWRARFNRGFDVQAGGYATPAG